MIIGVRQIFYEQKRVDPNMPEQFISVVVPVFNAAGTIEELVMRINSSLSQTSVDCEIVLVDDHSSDLTWEKLCALYDEHENLKVIRLTKNFGQQCATLCGLFRSTGCIIVTMDDDLQHRPEEIPVLIEKIREGHDVVMARFDQKKHSIFKLFTSKGMDFLNKILIGKPSGLRLSSFRAFRNSVIEQMKEIGTSYPFIPAMIFSMTSDIVNVTLEHDVSRKGRTTYSLTKYLKIASNLIVNNSSLLLKLTGLFGILISIVSFCFGAFLIVRKLVLGEVLVGWTSTIVSIYLLGGLTLFSLGVIGEYLLRIIVETTNRPYYFIREEKL